jgi:hypothetical protein
MARFPPVKLEAKMNDQQKKEQCSEVQRVICLHTPQKFLRYLPSTDTPPS